MRGDDFPPVLLVHMGSPEEGEHFLGERWPEARAVSDEGKDLYAGFGLARGSLGQLLGPRALWAGLVATLRGHGPGRPIGDTTMMSGWFLVQGDALLWDHVHEHAGESRHWDELADAWAACGGDRTTG